jgi:D-arabinonate dehydratase/D-galactarolactone cycloisomerase
MNDLAAPALADRRHTGQIRITKVEAISLFVPIEEKIEAPISIPHAAELTGIIFKGYRTTLVRIETDCGISGVGECIVRLTPTATRDIIRDLAPLLIGKDPLDREALWELLFGAMMNRGHNRGFFVEAVSGVDIALWDLAGKALGLPLYRLLGGRHQEKLRAYASSLRFRAFDIVTAQAREWKSRGFGAMKIKIGRDPSNYQPDLDLVRAIREAVGDDVTLMVDANCAYSEDVATALEVGRKLQDMGVYWFEEPISPENVDGYQHLADRLDLRIAGGEADFLRFGAAEFLKRRAIDVIQPNLARVGGVTEARRIAALSHAFHVPYAPHTGSCSAVLLAATLRFAAALPNFLIYEYMQSDWSKNQPNPLRHKLLRQPAEVYENGYMLVDERPGIGVDLDEDIVDKYRMA